MKIELKDALNLIDSQQRNYIELAKKDKSKKKQVDAILTSTTLLKMELQKLPQTKEDLKDLANEFESELFKLVNLYASKGLSKPDSIRKLKWVLGSSEMS